MTGRLGMTFAIVTPSFNKAPYLRRCLSSVLEQDLPGVDYWLLDNCSTDGSGAIIADFRARYADRLKVIVERDNGQAAAINHGFTLAHGDIMGWLNADDFYLPGTLAKVADFFSAHPDVDLVYGHTRILDGEFRHVGDFPVQPHDLRILKSYDYISQPAAFWRRRVWETAGPLDPNLNWCLDWDFFLRAACHFRVEFVDALLAEAVCDGQHKTATGGLPKTREIARVSRRHSNWRNPTNLFCHFVLALHWLAGPWLRSPRTAPATRRMLDRLQSYWVTVSYRGFGAQVMA
jgi:glycosyltransferase involved in cell wall biosynthesis